MSLEKFIRGKLDDCKHAGRASNRRREQEADNRLSEYYREGEGTEIVLFPQVSISPLEKASEIVSFEPLPLNQPLQ